MPVILLPLLLLPFLPLLPLLPLLSLLPFLHFLPLLSLLPLLPFLPFLPFIPFLPKQFLTDDQQNDQQNDQRFTRTKRMTKHARHPVGAVGRKRGERKRWAEHTDAVRPRREHRDRDADRAGSDLREGVLGLV